MSGKPSALGWVNFHIKSHNADHNQIYSNCALLLGISICLREQSGLHLPKKTWPTLTYLQTKSLKHAFKCDGGRRETKQIKMIPSLVPVTTIVAIFWRWKLGNGYDDDGEVMTAMIWQKLPFKEVLFANNANGSLLVAEFFYCRLFYSLPPRSS